MTWHNQQNDDWQPIKLKTARKYTLSWVLYSCSFALKPAKLSRVASTNQNTRPLARISLMAARPKFSRQTILFLAANAT